jgi:hypothetical protein
MANIEINKGNLYKAWLIHLQVTGREDVCSQYKAVYGNSHEQDDDESDLAYIARCAEQDYCDGEHDAAVYQKVFNSLNQNPIPN